MENQRCNGATWRAEPQRSRKRARRTDDDEDGDGVGEESAQRIASRRHTQHGVSLQQCWDQQRHGAVQEEKKRWLEALGVANLTDPITEVPLEPQRPLALLVNEESGALTGFDLHSLYHTHLKRGKTWVRTFDGRFRLQAAEVASLVAEYARYFGA